MIKTTNSTYQHDEFGGALDLMPVMPHQYHQLLLNKKMNNHKGQDFPLERPGGTRKNRSPP